MTERLVEDGMNTLLGNRIRELRKARAFTQEQVAERLEISRQRYARIENGTNNITLEILIKLAEILVCQSETLRKSWTKHRLSPTGQERMKLLLKKFLIW